MKSEIVKLIGCALLASLIVVAPLHAQDDEDDDFTPRSGAPPAKRTGGASRTEGKITVVLLAPAESTGLTTRAAPVIYWHISGETDAPIEIGINDPTKLENPVLETGIKGPHKAGLHKLELSKLAQDGKPVELQPGIKYELVVTAAVNEASGSENPSATCVVMRLDPKDAPKPGPDDRDPARQAAFFAKQGIWFDYLDALNAAIEANPKDDALIQKRAKALAAQGLLWKSDGTITEKTAEKS
jgi:hypothetical protein